MQVDIVDFPETLVAALEHHGPEHLTYNTTKKFIEWRQANGLRHGTGNTYGVHYTDPAATPPEDYRLDICLSVGLQSVGSFTTSFTRTYGRTPTEYRAAFPPASIHARVPACVVRFYGRPQRRTFREDNGAGPA